MKGWFYAVDHQRKSEQYVNALLRHGWKYTPTFNKAEFILSDSDVFGRRRLVDQAHEHGKKVFLYPHAARAMIQWDGFVQPSPYITANFVIAECHAEVMRRYGYPHQTEVTGWTYCYQRPFQPTAGVKVLFGPIHPNANGWLPEVDLSINRRVYQILLELARNTEIQLTVRHLDTLENNGLWREPGVRYVLGRPDLSIADVDAADVVVTTQTLLYLSVARGVPTIGMGEDVAPHYGNSNENFHYVASWEKYRDIMQFPLDLLTTDHPWQLIHNAARDDEMIRDWRHRCIGKVFDPAHFVEIIDRYMGRETQPAVSVPEVVSA